MNAQVNLKRRNGLRRLVFRRSTSYRVSGSLVSLFTQIQFKLLLHVCVNWRIFPIRESDQPGPADLLRPGREAADLCGALCPEWEDRCFTCGPATACPTTLRGRAPGRRVVGCSSARG